MDSIKQAVELARAAETARRRLRGPSVRVLRKLAGQLARSHRSAMFALNAAHLELREIVAHGSSSEHGRYYDMLRTQVLQEMDKKSWQFLAVTSPTAGCGKSSDRLQSCDEHCALAGAIRCCWWIWICASRCCELSGHGGTGGVLSVLEGRATLSSAVLQASIGPNSFWFLPGSVSSPVLPNGWPHKRWARSCRPSRGISDRAL